MSSIPGGFQREFNFPLRAPIDFIFIQFVGLTKWVLDSKGYVYRTNLRPSKLTIRACRFFKIDTVVKRETHLLLFVFSPFPGGEESRPFSLKLIPFLSFPFLLLFLFSFPLPFFLFFCHSLLKSVFFSFFFLLSCVSFLSVISSFFLSQELCNRFRRKLHKRTNLHNRVMGWNLFLTFSYYYK